MQTVHLTCETIDFFFQRPAPYRTMLLLVLVLLFFSAQLTRGSVLDVGWTDGIGVGYMLSKGPEKGGGIGR